MAQRRMTSLEVIDTDAFLAMPATSQLLYFHLNARADDDGFVASPKKILRSIGGNEDDLGMLLLKKFLIAFEDGVCVIKHWRLNNFIRKDIYKPTNYLNHKRALFIRANGAYTLSDDGKAIPVPEGHFKLEYVDATLTERQLRIGEDREDLSAEAEANNKEPMNTYNENKHSGDDLPDLDLDSQEIVNASVKKKDIKKASPVEEEVFDLFRGNPARGMWGMRPIERAAARILYDTFGIEELERRMKVIEKSKDEPWCPQIDTPSELLEKMPKMERYLKTV